MTRNLLLSSMAIFPILGCGGPEGSVRIDSALAQSAALEKAHQTNGSLDLPTASGTLSIAQVSITVSELELEGDEDEELEAEGRTIFLALDGSPVELAFESVGEGSYRTIGLELQEGGAIRVTGSFEGGAFEYVSQQAPEVEYALATPITVVAGEEAAVELAFDVAAWFLGPDGAALDPRDPANGPTIEGNILTSITANAVEVELEGD